PVLALGVAVVVAAEEEVDLELVDEREDSLRVVALELLRLAPVVVLRLLGDDGKDVGEEDAEARPRTVGGEERVGGLEALLGEGVVGGVERHEQDALRREPALGRPEELLVAGRARVALAVPGLVVAVGEERG